MAICVWGKDLWHPDEDSTPCETEGADLLLVSDTGDEFWLCDRHLYVLGEHGVFG